MIMCCVGSSLARGIGYLIMSSSFRELAVANDFSQVLAATRASEEAACEPRKVLPGVPESFWHSASHLAARAVLLRMSLFPLVSVLCTLRSPILCSCNMMQYHVVWCHSANATA